MNHVQQSRSTALRHILSKDWQTTMAIKKSLEDRTGTRLDLFSVRETLSEMATRGEVERKAEGHGFAWRLQ